MSVFRSASSSPSAIRAARGGVLLNVLILAATAAVRRSVLVGA
eukprot:COSAG06_NODE_54166_length_296_cov_0.720812_1_plen_42_part_01